MVDINHVKYRFRTREITLAAAESRAVVAESERAQTRAVVSCSEAMIQEIEELEAAATEDALTETHVRAAHHLHGDDTTVPLVARGGAKKARLWTYVRDDRPRNWKQSRIAKAPYRSLRRMLTMLTEHAGVARRHPSTHPRLLDHPRGRSAAVELVDPRGRSKAYEVLPLGAPHQTAVRFWVVFGGVYVIVLRDIEDFPGLAATYSPTS